MSKGKRNYSSFGIWVKIKLMEQDMEQRELAEKLGVSESYLSDILTGRTKGLKYTDTIISILSKKEIEYKEVI
ncbi:MAG: helix-turn-helix transcriptional regulator [Vallitalea sp.]|jgi:transcriptional regulator with XRE-family HTH domain|nr:helix-turn-helix transcriptional regulator [Vallitalea sp.]